MFLILALYLIMPSQPNMLRGADDEKAWPRAVEGFVSPEPGEHPRLFFRRSEIPELRRRLETAEGQAILGRLKKVLGGGEALPRYYQAATEAYEDAAAAGSRDVVSRIDDLLPGGQSLPGTDLLDLLSDEESPEASVPRPPWAREEGVYLFDDLPTGAYTVSHAAGFAFLWVLTEEQRYADLARESVELALRGQRDRDNRYSLVNPGGMLRAGPSLACYAMAYDLCYDAWPEEFRRELALYIQNYDGGDTGRDGGSRQTLELLCHSPRMFPTSNHWGMQVGGATLALLAIKGDPGTDAALISRHLEAVTRNTHALFDSGFGSRGTHSEGHHPTRMTAAWIGPAMTARRNVLGEDWVTGNPNMEYLCTRWIYEIVRYGDNLHVAMFGRYADPGFSRRGLNGGDFAQGFGYSPREHLPALKWFHENVIDPRPLDERDFDAVEYPHHAVQAFVNWPLDVAAMNPADVLWQRVYLDYRKGHVVFRNGWHADSSQDIAVSCSIGTRRGYGGVCGGGPVMLLAHGRRLELPCNLHHAGSVSYLRAAADGSGVLSLVVKNTYLAVDFSGASGADVLVVMTGDGAGEASHMAVGPTAVRTVESGWRMFAVSVPALPDSAFRVEGDVLHIGAQTVIWREGRLHLGKMAESEVLYENEGHFISYKEPSPDPEKEAERRRRELEQQLQEQLSEARRLIAAGQREPARKVLEGIIRQGGRTAQAVEARRMNDQLLLDMATDAIDFGF